MTLKKPREGNVKEMKHTSSFDIMTADDFFRRVLIPQYEDFTAKNSSSRHALLTTIVAYHMYEWVNGKKFTIEDFESKYPQNSALSRVFELAKNITNGTKHYRNKAKTRSQTGFSSDFDNSFARPLMVEFPDGHEKSVDKFLGEMVDFWRKQISIEKSQ
jgi:hypothetical protein